MPVGIGAALAQHRGFVLGPALEVLQREPRQALVGHGAQVGDGDGALEVAPGVVAARRRPIQLGQRGVAIGLVSGRMPAPVRQRRSGDDVEAEPREAARDAVRQQPPDIAVGGAARLRPVHDGHCWTTLQLSLAHGENRSPDAPVPWTLCPGSSRYLPSPALPGGASRGCLLGAPRYPDAGSRIREPKPPNGREPASAAVVRLGSEAGSAL